MIEELLEILREATTTVETELALEDEGWIKLGTTGLTVTSEQRRLAVHRSRTYYAKDPLGKQSIRLWTDYTFGKGMSWSTEEEQTKKVIDAFWGAEANQAVLSARGQRKSSDKLLVDGEVFFALFLGPSGMATIRRIDPLEITEIITNPDDVEDVRFYRRAWSTPQGQQNETIYRSTTNLKGEATPDKGGASVSHNDKALVYHLAYNTIEQRGNPLLLPAIDWIKQYRRFLASRVAIMLALAKFAWKMKVKGGQTVVEAVKGAYDEKAPAAGSALVENLGVDTTPIKAESGARNAYDDARMLKLQVCAAAGIPEQYYGDLETGNLATAKTVELPMMKQFQSYQQVWLDTYRDIDELVLAHNDIPKEKWYVDRDFPPIAPADVAQMAQSVLAILQALPEFAYVSDVQQVALMSLGIDDTAKVLDAMAKEAKSDPNVKLSRALREFKSVIIESNKRAQLAEEMTPADWKAEYKGETPHWAEDKTPSLFAQDFVVLMQEYKVKNVLEIGCGNGRDSVFFAKSGIKATAVDIVPKAIELAKDTAKKADETIDFRIANAEKLPFNDGNFGAVFSLSVLHSTDLKLSIAEISRILKSGGVGFVYIYGNTQYSSGKKEDTIILSKYLELLRANNLKLLDFYTQQQKDFDEYGEKHQLFVATFQKGG